MTVTPQMIKELRDRTGIGMTKCKEALEQAQGDLEKAIEQLRKAGMASAVKKEGRATNEGLIGTAESGNTIAIVEGNAETDFVVKNEKFLDFVRNVSEEAAATNPDTLEAFLSQKFSKDNTLTIDEYRAQMVQTIGENIQISRIKTFKKEGDLSIGVYSHLGGKIVVVVEISGSADETDLARDIAMHIAAAAPEYIKPEDIPAEVVEKEKEIALSQIQGKPENIIEKILTGKLNSYYDTVCLNRQGFIKDDSLKIEQLAENRAKETGKPLTITRFTRWSIGQ